MKSSFVFIGVSGCGKSAVAEAVANKINVPFLDGDFLHSRVNIDKMASGKPLNDEDRKLWLEAINSAIYAMQHTHDISILTCSALKESYRNMLNKGNTGVYFIYLKGDFDLIAQRLQNRKGHFFKSDMLKYQFETLEEPSKNEDNIYVIDVDKTLDEVVNDSIEFIHKIRLQKTT